MARRGPKPKHPDALKLSGTRKGQRAARASRPSRKPRLKITQELPVIGDLGQIITTLPGYDPYASAEGFEFNEEAARAAVQFFHEELCHVKGAKARHPFILEEWQQAIIGNLFGWKDERGLRRYRECFIEVARKNGKSPMAAGILLYVLFNDDEPGAEIYGAASEYRQASLVFEHARGMVAYNPRLAGRAQIFKGQAKAIQLGEDEGWSTYRVIPASEDAIHGGNIHCAVIDELHAIDKRGVVENIMTGTGARLQPLIIHITTSDYERESICNEKEDYAKKVREGVIDDPRFLPVIYEAQLDDDWTDPDVWTRANPNLGVSVSREYLERECQRAKDSTPYLNTFKRLHLNIRTMSDVAWLQIEDWDACLSQEEPEDGATCFAGLDLASTTDIAALSLVFPRETGYLLRTRYWAPRDSAIKRERDDRVPYVAWADEGHITLTQGNVIDYDVIRRDIGTLGQRYDIREIAIDRWNSTQMQTQLVGDGFEIVQYGQGFASMTAPTKELEALVLDKGLAHDGDPVTRWMASNVMVEIDAAGNLKPSKAKSNEKIDGIVSTIMGLGRAMLQEEDTGYELRSVSW